MRCSREPVLWMVCLFSAHSQPQWVDSGDNFGNGSKPISAVHTCYIPNDRGTCNHFEQSTSSNFEHDALASSLACRRRVRCWHNSQCKFPNPHPFSPPQKDPPYVVYHRSNRSRSLQILEPGNTNGKGFETSGIATASGGLKYLVLSNVILLKPHIC